MNDTDLGKMLAQEYPSYEIREKVKYEGWERIRNAETDHKKAFYYLHCIIWSHYWRAREATEGSSISKKILRAVIGKKYYPGYELDIDHYTSHWLWANRKQFSDGVMKEMNENFYYDPEENKFMPDGCTSYQYPAPKEKNRAAKLS